MKKKTCIIISISSDIGFAMAQRWMKMDYEVYGTYRNDSDNVRKLRNEGAKVIKCDIGCVKSINVASEELRVIKWDVLILAVGSQEPVGPFTETNFDNWADSININFVNQLRIIRQLLPNRNIATNGIEPCVIFFAGGGTNCATVNYSAYTVSKIALIKMCELLDAEVCDARFAIVGPGWVKTKIHNSTINAREFAGDNYDKTLHKLASDECTPMDKVLDCCDWIISSPRNVVSGRNFSVVFDRWGDVVLDRELSANVNMYKLRRNGNDWVPNQSDKGKNNV